MGAYRVAQIAIIRKLTDATAQFGAGILFGTAPRLSGGNGR